MSDTFDFVFDAKLLPLKFADVSVVGVGSCELRLDAIFKIGVAFPQSRYPLLKGHLHLPPCLLAMKW